MSDTDSLLERMKKFELAVRDIHDAQSRLWSEVTGTQAKIRDLREKIGLKE